MKYSWKVVQQLLLLLAALALLALPACFTNSVFGYLPILLGLLTLGASGLFLMLARRGLSVTGTGKPLMVVRGGSAPVELRFVNSTPLVCPKIAAEVYISDCFGETEGTAEAVFTMDRRCSVDFGFDMTLEHVGVYTAGIRKVRLYGLLGLWSLELSVSHRVTVTVLPRVYPVDDHLADIQPTDSPFARRFLENDGFDYTGAREYVYGDSMKNIHWKLSAHTHTLMTRIYELGLQSDLTVVLDMAADHRDKSALLSMNDTLTEYSVSLCRRGIERGIDCRLLYARRDGNIAVLAPQSREEHAALVQEITRIGMAGAADDAEAILREESEMPGRTANVVVCTARITDGLLQALIHAHEQRRSCALCCVLPPDATQRQRHDAEARLRMLDEYGIYYEVISP